jgi:hypothetical protein
MRNLTPLAAQTRSSTGHMRYLLDFELQGESERIESVGRSVGRILAKVEDLQSRLLIDMELSSRLGSVACPAVFRKIVEHFIRHEDIGRHRVTREVSIRTGTVSIACW